MQTTVSGQPFFRASRTSVVMRGIIVAILLGAFAFVNLPGTPPAVAQGGAVVSISTASVNIGATVVVNVSIQNVTNLAGAEVHFTYDPFLLEVQSVQAGGFPAPDFVAQSSATGGKIDYAIAQMPPHTPVSGSGVLLQVTFKGLAAGTSALHMLSVVLSDGSGTLIPSTTQDGSVVVGGSTTPVPTTPAPTTPAPTTPAPTTPAPTTPPPGANVNVVPASSSAAVNSTVAVAVQMTNASNLWGVDLKLTYNASGVQCTQSQLGSIPMPHVVATNTCGSGAAQYIVTQQSPDVPSSGSGNIVQLTFKCLMAGTFSLHLDHVTLVNKDGQTLPATVADGQITCTQPSSGNILGYHTVKPGETLYCVGRAYSVSPWAIAGTNYIPWPYWLYPGQVLAIPNVPWYNIPPGPVCQPQFGGTTPPPTPTPGPYPTPTPGLYPTPVPGYCRYYHTVQWGQTLSGIAWYYGTTVQAIMYANPSITNPNLIYAGQVLCIP